MQIDSTLRMQIALFYTLKQIIQIFECMESQADWVMFSFVNKKICLGVVQLFIFIKLLNNYLICIHAAYTLFFLIWNYIYIYMYM